MPSIGLLSAVQNVGNELRSEPKLALVIPAFQRKGGNCKTFDQCKEKLEPLDETIPRTLEGLVNCLDANRCIPFQSDNSPTSHSTTEVGKWLYQTNLRQIKCFHSTRYEPYLIVSSSLSPPYDERFSGYGKNKIQHVAHLRRLGFRFAVLPKHFLVHVPHPKSTSKHKWIHSYETHKAVDKLYDTFLKELELALPTPPLVPLCFSSSSSKRKQKNKGRTDSNRRLRGSGEGGSPLDGVHAIAQRYHLPLTSSSLPSSRAQQGPFLLRQRKMNFSFSFDSSSHGADDDTRTSFLSPSSVLLYR